MKRLLLAALLTLCAFSAAAAPSERATLLFTGDLMAHSPQINVARRKKGYDFSPSFAAVSQHVGSLK